jgi:hypothetical protein
MDVKPFVVEVPARLIGLNHLSILPTIRPLMSFGRPAFAMVEASLRHPISELKPRSVLQVSQPCGS